MSTAPYTVIDQTFLSLAAAPDAELSVVPDQVVLEEMPAG